MDVTSTGILATTWHFIALSCELCQFTKCKVRAVPTIKSNSKYDLGSVLARNPSLCQHQPAGSLDVIRWIQATSTSSSSHISNSANQLHARPASLSYQLLLQNQSKSYRFIQLSQLWVAISNTRDAAAAGKAATKEASIPVITALAPPHPKWRA